jgi:signal transduction histidine kinase/CheY-like chemotaxis protein
MLNDINKKRRESENNKLRAAIRELKEENKKLQMSIEELRKAKEQAEENNHMKSVFLANMSHEIRTPMNAILGFSNLIRDDHITNENKNRFVELILENGNSLLNLIDDIIDISKIDSAKLKINPERCNLSELLNGLYLYYINTLGKDEKLEVDIKLEILDEDRDKDIFILTDPYRLKQILSNLINNAIKFTSKGLIEFGYNKRVGGIIEFYVKDTGIGIASDMQHFIFKRFSQIKDYIFNECKGSGLGLSISKQLVELLGGNIWVDSEEGVGSTFYFTLPSGAKEVSKNNEIEEVNIRMEPSNWKDKVIVIAEDEKTNHLYLKSILDKTNVKVYWAQNGFDAIDLCERRNVDLILMDIRMAGMGGVEATIKIKSKYPDIPIIAQTAYAMNEDIDRIMKAGCSSYLIKPVKAEEILALIDKYFQKIENSVL